MSCEDEGAARLRFLILRCCQHSPRVIWQPNSSTAFHREADISCSSMFFIMATYVTSIAAVY
ncbi:hypothetical protein BDW60DRAFT_171073 [Aspergillus nidulans var. acristatus]